MADLLFQLGFYNIVMGSAVSSISPLKKQVHRPLRPVRPNLKQIYALPLPISVYALPPLFPHNPFSVLQIAFTYLIQLVVPPSSHPQVLYQGFLSPETHSVHVLDADTIRILWERGFFGKGSLSRSEPSWFEREKKRKGYGANETSEEVTRKRREARKVFKKERARKETEAIEEKLLQEGQKAPNRGVDASPAAFSKLETSSSSSSQPLPIAGDQASKNLKGTLHKSETSLKGRRSKPPDHDREARSRSQNNSGSITIFDIRNEEHLQLSPEESFFLLYGLGVLQIRDPVTSKEISTESVFSRFRQFSYFPPRQPFDLHPDDPFLVSYIVYHHFRSLGWVVRPGIKFAVDYLLYNRGPVFSHAEFAVAIIPAYTHPHWHSNPEISRRTRKKETRSWWWLHCVNRVQSQVRKSLVLVYVEIPPPLWADALPTSESQTSIDGKEAAIFKGEQDKNITAILKRYKVREISIRRWTPNRSRD